MIRAEHLMLLAERAAQQYTQNVSVHFELYDSLVRTALPHLRMGYEHVNDADVLFYGCTPALPGGYYPTLHWDTDWYMFPEAAGFQMWCVALMAHSDGSHSTSCFV